LLLSTVTLRPRQRRLLPSGYTNAIVTHCEELRTFPNFGTRRDDIRSSLQITNYKLQITNYKKCAVIVFAVNAELVSIIGIYYGGQNYEANQQFDLND
jgi:toxin ParE1/3/4